MKKPDEQPEEKSGGSKGKLKKCGECLYWFLSIINPFKAYFQMNLFVKKYVNR